METLFKLKQYGTNVRTEIVAGVTTFLTMAYIIFVNPSILGTTGMNPDGVFVATILAAAVGTLMMAFVANLPYAQAPGMGLNAFFAFTVCGIMGFTWQEALAMVFICGIIGMIVTVTKARHALMRAIPASLQHAIGGAIGLFIAYIGLKNAGIIQFVSTSEGLTPGAAAVPGLVNFTETGVLIALAGLVITVVLMLLKLKGALLWGILITTVISLVTGFVEWPGFKALFDLSRLGGIGDVAGAAFTSQGFGSLFADSSRVFLAIVAIFAFAMTDIFDTIGTFIGTGRRSGIFDEAEEKTMSSGKAGFSSRMERGLFSDLTATTTGAVLGTSNVTTYVESAAGIGVGGRTGLTALTTAVCLLLCLPLAAVAGLVPSQATAPALMLVGVLMMGNFSKIKWDDFEEALPAFFTVLIMAFGYSISYGIAAGFLFYCIVKLVTGKVKELHPILIGATLLFLLNFVMQAVA